MQNSTVKRSFSGYIEVIVICCLKKQERHYEIDMVMMFGAKKTTPIMIGVLHAANKQTCDLLC